MSSIKHEEEESDVQQEQQQPLTPMNTSYPTPSMAQRYPQMTNANADAMHGARHAQGADNSPALTIDNDSQSSTRPHIMGYPGLRIRADVAMPSPSPSPSRIPAPTGLRRPGPTRPNSAFIRPMTHHQFPQTPQPQGEHLHSRRQQTEPAQSPGEHVRSLGYQRQLQQQQQVNRQIQKLNQHQQQQKLQQQERQQQLQLQQQEQLQLQLQQDHIIQQQLDNLQEQHHQRRRSKYAQLNSERADPQAKQQWRQTAAANSPLGITEDSELHDKLILVPAEDPQDSQNKVDRLEVVQPSKAIVVESRGEKKLHGSIEAIYCVLNENEPKSFFEDVYGERGCIMVDGCPVFRDQLSEAELRRLTLLGCHAEDLLETQAERDKLYAEMSQRVMQFEANLRQQAAEYQAAKEQQANKQPVIEQPIIQQPIEEQAIEQPPIEEQPIKKQSISDRPIAIPKSRLGRLQPAHRRMPRSKEVAEAGPVYRGDGSLVARRHEVFVFSDEQPQPGDPEINLTDSFYNDPGYDLALADLDSSFFRSFDVEDIPEAPARRLSTYNIGVKDVPRRSPTPESSPKLKSSPTLESSSRSTRGFVDALESPERIATAPAPAPMAPSTRTTRAAGYSVMHSGMPSPAVSHSTERLYISDFLVNERDSNGVLYRDLIPQPGDGPGISISMASSSSERMGMAAKLTATSKAQPISSDSEAEFYTHMLLLRSSVPPEELTPPVSPQSKLQSSPRSAESAIERNVYRMQKAVAEQQAQNVPQMRRAVTSERVPPAPQMRRAVTDQHVPAAPQMRMPETNRSATNRFGTDRLVSSLRNAELQLHVPTVSQLRRSETDKYASRTRRTEVAEPTRPLSMPLGPSIHRYQQPEPQTNFWPTGPPVQPSTSADNSIESCFGSSASFGRLLPRVSLPIPCPPFSCAKSEHDAPRRVSSSPVTRKTKRANVPVANDRDQGSDRVVTNHPSRQRQPEFEYVPRGSRTEPSPLRQKPTGGSVALSNNAEIDTPLRRASSNQPGSNQPSPKRTSSKRTSERVQSDANRRWRWWCKSNTDAPARLPYNHPANASSSHLRAVTGSWAHIFRTQNAGRAINPRRRRSRVRDMFVYPFELSFNCFLWCLSPCVGLGRECRSAF
ncbi:hypothetical protein GGH96_005970 [Coemansia sp. RSA 1972]|nr:hypothetical protein GGH96_005970 [Coemansia sp. RSA 1972]